jgi:dCTP diphosphatase
MAGELEALKETVRAFARERDWEQFHTPKNLAMAMSVEAAEVVEIFQWLTDKQAQALNKEEREHLSDELADTFVYLLKLADAYGIDLVEAARKKMVKNAKKYPVAKAKGSAKKYDAL